MGEVFQVLSLRVTVNHEAYFLLDFHVFPIFRRTDKFKDTTNI